MTLGSRLITARGGGGSIIASLSRYNEEFNAPLGGEWSVLASSNGSYDVDTTAAGGLYMAGSASTTFMGIYKPAPEPPFTVTAYISEVVNDASDYSDCGVMLGEATPGDFIHGCWDVAFLGGFTIIGSHWNDPSNWDTNIGPGISAGSSPLAHYSRFVVNTQNDVDGYYSTDGTSWTQWLSAYNPPFTIGSVGLDLHNLSSATSMTVDWLRFE